ncbi:MAG: UxaA family hydrolase [Dehalococcoidia bacterium]
MENNALKINSADNVVVAIRNVKKGDPVVVAGETLFKAAQDVELGHKIAISLIKSGSRVIRYGEPILKATCDIQQGQWVHLHNTQPELLYTAS